MPRDDRSFVVATLGSIIAAFLIGLHLQPEKPDLSGDRRYREHAASYQARPEGCKPEQLARITLPKRTAKAEACQNAQQQHQEASHSLIEAGRAADAADATAVLAYEQTGIAAWGLAAGVLTLFAAAAAAFYARVAAEQTRRGADAAIRSTEIAGRTNLPILVLTNITSDHCMTAGDGGYVPQMPIQIRLTFHNYGQTVAILQRFWFEVIVTEGARGGQSFTEHGRHTFLPDQVITPDASYPIKDEWTHVSVIENQSMVMDRRAQLLFTGHIEFSDFLGQTHRTGFLFGWSRNGGDYSSDPPVFTQQYDPTGKYVFRDILPRQETRPS